MTSPARRAVRKARRYVDTVKARRSRESRRVVEGPPWTTPADGKAMIRFFAGEKRKSNWSEVEFYLDDLHARDGALFDLFVRTGLEHTRAPAEIVSLARHPLSAGVVRDWLTHQVAPKTPRSQRVIGRHEMRDAAYVGAARLLLPPDGAERAHRLVPVKTSRYYQVLSSLGTRPVPRADDPAKNAAVEPALVRHRLVIVDNVLDPAAVALLFPGSDEVTVLATSDPFGMSDFAKYAGWTTSGEIHVEHTRTRITRFSAAYVELHEAVARVAERIVAELAALPGLLHPDDEPFLTVDVADFLFFLALRVQAVETLLDDDTFDDVVVAVADHGLRSEFMLLLADLPRLLSDPRTQFLSVSPGVRRRADFWRLLDTVMAPLERPLRATAQLPVETVVADFAAEARRQGDELVWPGDDLSGSAAPSDWLLLATLDNPAYNPSTAAYAAELAEARPVRVLHTAGSAEALTTALAGRGVSGRVPVLAREAEPAKDNALADMISRLLPPLCRELRESATTVSEASAAKAFDVGLDRLSATRIVPALLRQKVYEHRFETWREAGTLPAAVIVTPHRDPGVGGLAAVARRHGVPSVALEPHMQDANYSRYLKIATDYYGVFSQYFAANAVENFGMPPDRVKVLGTPRLVAPPGYDRAAAQREARDRLTAETGFDFGAAPLHVVFFGQPSSWAQLERTWTMVLDAARKVGAHVLLKPHPEESPSRIRRYFEDAGEHGVASTVTLLGGANNTAANAVDLADLVLTTYSAAAVDAAIRQTPVVSVADGDTAYPIDVAAIVDARTARSVAQLADVFEDFVRDPDPALARARALLDREPYFVTGPGANVRALLDDVVADGAGGLRAPDETPRSLFLDGPHPVFGV